MAERPLTLSFPEARHLASTGGLLVVRPVKRPSHLGTDLSDWFGPIQSIKVVDGWVASYERSQVSGITPPWHPGERLWVREVWRLRAGWEQRAHVAYRADNPQGLYWNPAVTMPRWASRWEVVVESVEAGRLRQLDRREYARVAAVQAAKVLVRGAHLQGLPVWNRRFPSHRWESDPWVWLGRVVR